MDNRKWQANASATPPSPPASPSTGYPTNGGVSIPVTTPGEHWYHQIGEEMRAVIVAAGLTPSNTDLTQLLQAIDARVNKGYLQVVDEKAQGTEGGASILGTQVRALNTVYHNTIPGASLSANRITLPAGTYRVYASAPACQVNMQRAGLYNFTDSAYTLLSIGINGEASVNGTEILTFVSVIRGRFTIATTKVFELRHQTGVAVATYGLGSATNMLGAEIYSMVEIEKEA